MEKDEKEETEKDEKEETETKKEDEEEETEGVGEVLHVYLSICLSEQFELLSANQSGTTF